MYDNHLKIWFIRTISHSLSSGTLKNFWKKTQGIITKFALWSMDVITTIRSLT